MAAAAGKEGASNSRDAGYNVAMKSECVWTGCVHVGEKHAAHVYVLRFIIPSDLLQRMRELRSQRVADATGAKVEVGTYKTLGGGQHKRRLTDRGAAADQSPRGQRTLHAFTPRCLDHRHGQVRCCHSGSKHWFG